MTETHKQVTQHPRKLCYFCGSEGPIETHHIVPRRYNGSDNERNLVDLCPTCHQRLERLYDARFYEQLSLEGSQQTEPNPTEHENALFVRVVRELYLDNPESTIVTPKQTAVEIPHKVVAKKLNDETRLDISSTWVGQKCSKFEIETKRNRDGTVIKDEFLENKLNRLYDEWVLADGESMESETPKQKAKSVIETIVNENNEAAYIEQAKDVLVDKGVVNSPAHAENIINKLRRTGDVYEPKQNHLMTT